VDFHTHISVWAVEKHLDLMGEFKRAARGCVQELCGLTPGETVANMQRVAAVLAEGNLVRSPMLVIIIMQMFFLAGHKRLGWQLELLCRDLPNVVHPVSGEFQVILWWVRIPRSIVPRTMMIVSPCFWIKFTHVDTPYLM
jgi:hypothetical protein